MANIANFKVEAYLPFIDSPIGFCVFFKSKPGRDQTNNSLKNGFV